MRIKLLRLWHFIVLLFMLFSIPIAVVLLKETTSVITRARPKPANLVIDVSKVGFYKPSVWANFA